jgi:hypothetical protein
VGVDSAGEQGKVKAYPSPNTTKVFYIPHQLKVTYLGIAQQPDRAGGATARFVGHVFQVYDSIFF